MWTKLLYILNQNISFDTQQDCKFALIFVYGKVASPREKYNMAYDDGKHSHPKEFRGDKKTELLKIQRQNKRLIDNRVIE